MALENVHQIADYAACHRTDTGLHKNVRRRQILLFHLLTGFICHGGVALDNP